VLFIIAHHYVVNSGLTDQIYDNAMSVHSIFLLLLGAWGKTGINCFVLITGYFMCKSNITMKKFIKLLCEIEFYKIAIYLIFLVVGYEPFSLIGLIKVILPVISVDNGFLSCYLLFYLFIPFLNILVQHMNEKQHIKLLMLCISIYAILGTLPKFVVTMNYVSWFIVLYFIASYIRLYPKKLFSNTRFWGLTSLAVFLISALSVVVCVWLGTKLNIQLAYYFIEDSNKILAVLTAVSAFMFFKDVKLKYNRFINAVAATVFGVLLISGISDSMRRWLWGDILNNVGMYDSQWLFIHAFCSVAGIFVICSAIDYCRIYFIETPLLKLWDKNFDRFLSRYNDIEKYICKKFNIKTQED
jgi:hypothetical protein